MSRITHEQRNLITKFLLEKRFKDEEHMVAIEESNLALAVYKDKFDAEERAKMESLPEGWLHRVKKIMGRFNGTDYAFTIHNGEFLIPHSSFYHGECSKFLAAPMKGTKLHTQFELWHTNDRNLKARKEEIRLQINTAISAASSPAKLIKLWPEIAETVDLICGRTAQPSLLPVPQMAKLNAALGLKAVA